MDAGTLLQDAARSGLLGLRLEPGLDETAITDFGHRLGVPIPSAIRELLRFTRGFEYEPFGKVSFVGVEEFAFEALCPKGIALAGDGAGNFSVVDIDPKTGAWGRVLFVSHDPPVVVIQAADVAKFTEGALAAGRSGQRGLTELTAAAVTRAWRDDPYLVNRAEALASKDERLVSFAISVSESSRIADLRVAEDGAGFSWGRTGPTAEPRRCGADLLFAIDAPKGGSFWNRLLGRGHRR